MVVQILEIFVELVNKKQSGGTMRRYIHDRNCKICQDCFEKLDKDKQQEHVWLGQLHRNRLL